VTYALDCNGKRLSLESPVVMGVLNVTPDSFSDGGRFDGLQAACAQAERMLREGAAVIDIGGESTRPGAAAVSAEEECRRVLPVIEALAHTFPVPISVDTSKPEVMRAAVAAGAGMINDIRALREPGALAAAMACGVPVCLMHMQGEPRTMQLAPHYGNVVAEVRGFLAARIDACLAAGMRREQLVIDPGFGFGKTLEHNLELFAALDRFIELDVPLLVGVSRKSMVGALTGKPLAERLAGSIAAATLAVWKGAHIIRAHDVAQTADALAIARAVRARRG
jgi:dihydropteroate synthase